MHKPYIRLGWLSLALLITTCLMAADNTQISDKARKQGMEKAPALATASGITCTITDARLIEGSRKSSFAGSTMNQMSGGSGDGGGGGGSPPPSGGGGGGGGGGSPPPSGGGGGGASSAQQYEVACSEGLGYVITAASRKGEQPQASLCLELEDMGAPAGGPPGGAPGGSRPSGQGGMSAGGMPPSNQGRCLLPANATQINGLLPFIAKAGLQCTVTRARGLGHTASSTLFEVACDDNNGYVLATSLPPNANKDVQAANCTELPATSNIRCSLTDPRAALMVADQLMAKSGVACKVVDRRMFGSNTAGDKFYEIACEQGSGYVVQQTAAGEFGQAVTCADIGATAGGCQLANNKK